MEAIHIIGRILFGGFFVVMGINHFIKLTDMTGYAKSKRIPMPRLSVMITGVMLFLGGLSVVVFSNKFLAPGIILLVVFLFFSSVMVHQFWKVSDPQMKMVEMTNFTKNMALLGAGLIILSQFVY